jgi:hypothetical protein
MKNPKRDTKMVKIFGGLLLVIIVITSLLPFAILSHNEETPTPTPTPTSTPTP